MNPNELLSTEVVYAKLRDDILRGTLLPGERLSTQRLAEEFKVSRTPVREALARLESQGLTARVEGWGYVVRTITVRIAEEIFETRMVVEIAAAELATQRAEESELDAMALCLSKARAHLKKNDLINFPIGTRKFHELIVRATGNSVLLHMFMQLNDLVLLFGIALVKAYPSVSEQVMARNEQILKAIRARDPKHASKVTHDHICASHETYRKLSKMIRPDLIAK